MPDFGLAKFTIETGAAEYCGSSNETEIWS